jgi:molybdopterin-containing oxidoreductase family membrane subunit
MVILLIIMRKVSNLEAYITVQHIDEYCNHDYRFYCGVAYITELFVAWYSVLNMNNMLSNRATGPYWWAYWSMMTCNVFTTVHVV